MIPKTYSDFVAYVGQENTPPGGIDTITRWISDAAIDPKSVVLDLACNTAYSSRTVVARKGCVAFGLDISSCAIHHASLKSEKAATGVRFMIANAEAIPLAARSVTHVLAGSVFGFFARPRLALDECARVLQPKGYLCTATFYYVRRPPEVLLDGVAKAVGFRPHAGWTKNYWNDFFETRFRRLSSHDMPLKVESPQAIAVACHATLLRSDDVRLLADRDKAEALRRLYYCRLVFNEHRRYQKYTVQVWQA
jgi:SAM-dependent methyltransferase